MNIHEKSMLEIKEYYDEVLNKDKTTYKSTNDEPTPISCVEEMISKVPEELWKRKNLSILDPCCGNGNFFVPIYYKLLKYHKVENILEDILNFNDINEERIKNVEQVFSKDKCKLQITKEDFLETNANKKYDMIVANPPYAKLLNNGKRASKNHNLIKSFLEKSLNMLNPEGYIVFITPDNWMSYADRNTIISKLTSLQFIHLDIHSAKRYFKKIGSSFTWYIVKNKENIEEDHLFTVSGMWKNKSYESRVMSQIRNYIPLLYNSTVQSILSKTIDNKDILKYNVETSSDLHKYTKKEKISEVQTEEYKYKLIHTPKQIVYANKKHKYQEGYKVFISTTDKYKVFVDDCGMTQSIAFIRCENEKSAKQIMNVLSHDLYKFINNICRWGNFNNIRILQRFPKPEDESCIYKQFKITKEEIEFIENYL